MRVEDLSIATVSKAVSLYMGLAYGGGGRPGRVPDLSLPADATWEQVLGLFQKESSEAQGQRCVRYSLRLGNRNYPFMKLALQDHLLPGEFYFCVDTHDEMDIKPDFPDYEAWMAVRRFNQGLKRQIEEEFARAGLPSPVSLREAIERRLRGGRTCDVAAGERRSILVVDDEPHLCDTVACLLEARGYDVTKAGDGEAALTEAERLHPDLVVLDYELPEMDGLEVIARLRARESTRNIPVLLATASRISVDEIRKADGFLAKPFQEELLCSMVKRLLDARKVGR
ncbi:MAG: response regulator [Planctomycetes bacterium]|nr:response regulator [Planctomycetota bacterium]